MRLIESELKKIFKEICEEIRKDKNYFLSERDIQAYIYHRLRCKFGDAYCVNLDPTIPNLRKKWLVEKEEGWIFSFFLLNKYSDAVYNLIRYFFLLLH